MTNNSSLGFNQSADPSTYCEGILSELLAWKGERGVVQAAGVVHSTVMANMGVMVTAEMEALIERYGF